MNKTLAPLCALLLCMITFSANAHQADSTSAPLGKTIPERAAVHAQKLLSLQKKSNHLWKRAGWWNSANIFESLMDYHRLSKLDFSKEIKTIYRRNLYREQTRYLSPNSFDDNGWWALVWLKAYDMTGEKKYKAVSEHIFRDLVRRSWGGDCGGGMRWQYMGHYKNSITNELFMVLAARLALESSDSVQRQYYLGWALKDWQWFRQSAMFTDSLWISDALHRDCSCVIDPFLDLTYTQGVVLGALKYIYDLTGDRQYLDLAQKMAHASMKKYSNSEGILTENGGRKADVNRLQFKGIYMRYLALLNTSLHDESIKTFILHNADYGWDHCRSAEGYADYYWCGPYTDWSGSAQGSFMDLLNAALMQQ